jgi:hypothetical protein
MPDPKPAKAKLKELNPPPGQTAKEATVQFNPEMLKVTYANQIVQPKSEGKPQEKASTQYVGTGTTKLSLQIWFDVTGEAGGVDSLPTDVRELTRQVSYFITPQKVTDTEYLPPIISFEWGTFRFQGIMDSLEESLEFFSSDGVPLRASMTLSLSQQRIEILSGGKSQGSGLPPGAGGPGMPAPGTSPLAQARVGDTLQNMAARTGATWQAIASANGIENPRLLQPGQLIDLNAKVSVKI